MLIFSRRHRLKITAALILGAVLLFAACGISEVPNSEADTVTAVLEQPHPPETTAAPESATEEPEIQSNAPDVSEVSEDLEVSENSELLEEAVYLTLVFDYEKMAEILPVKAQELGADTIIYFRHETEPDSDYVETERHRIMREKCDEIGLLFVEQPFYHPTCGSDYARFMGEEVSPIVEEYGTDSVIVGLDNWRVFSMRTIFVPTHQGWFECPIGINQYRFSNYNSEDEIPRQIEVARENLAEIGELGRVASWAMPMKTLFALAAAEYGDISENSEQGIDLIRLEKIMRDIITENTGVQTDVYLKICEERENHVLVMPEYFTY
ncbi:MAG: DUF3798 domain-containing protein [Oscillospiraceae bacterium]|nr:DUF3798 domain-containing protein [Oscillospiraceae bacterium]